MILNQTLINFYYFVISVLYIVAMAYVIYGYNTEYIPNSSLDQDKYKAEYEEEKAGRYRISYILFGIAIGLTALGSIVYYYTEKNKENQPKQNNVN